MKLRTYLILFSVLIIGASMGLLFFQTRNILRAGFRQIQETKLDNISQLLLSLIESKKEELKNFSQAVRFNNDLSSAYILSMETKDRNLVGDKLNTIQKDTGLDFIEILSPSGRSFFANEDSRKIGASIRFKEADSGSILLEWQRKPMLAFYAPLDLYDQAVGTLVVGTFLDKLPASKVLKEMNADIHFTIDQFTPRPPLGKKRIQILTDDSTSLIYAVVTLNEESGKMLEQGFSGKLLWIGPISLLVLVILIYIFLEFGFLRKFMKITHAVQNYATSVAKGKVQPLSLEKHYIREIDKLRGAFENVTIALVQYERAFQEKRKVEDELEKQKVLIKLTQQVAHDIRSPLSSLQAAMGYLGNITIADPKALEVLNLLELSAKRLTGIADDLLKKHKGEGEDNKIIFSLHHILDELVGEYQGREEFKDLRFVKSYASQAIELYGDRAKLQRAFGNIIKNAVEAMESRGAVTLSTAKPNGKVKISIADTGPGMPADKLRRILEGGYTEGKQDGHGIGTKVVKETLSEFGGQITAESEVGEGTRFVIELPLPSVAENQSAQREKTAMESFTLELASDREPVLVVDDDDGLREQWRLVLKENNSKAILCDSYEDVVRQKISSLLTQTAVVDYHFDNSEKSGADVVRYLQSQGIKNITLCTAEYWKPSVQKLAGDLNAKLCPKPLPKIKIRTQAPGHPRTKEGFKVLVIDDDQEIRTAWEMLRERLHIEVLHAFPNLEAFQKEEVDLSAIDIAFVDKNIEGSRYSGSEVIGFLKSRGAARVVLASGENEAQLRKNPKFALADFISEKKIPENMEAFL